MPEIPGEIVEHRLGLTRPRKVRLMIVQAYSEPEDWTSRAGLYFMRDAKSLVPWINDLIGKASRETVDLLVLPELSVPAEAIPRFQAWSRESGSTIIAGSHYIETDAGFIARSPIIIAGDVYFTEKQVPAPAELSPVAGEGLNPGSTLSIFRDSPVGDFAVLICSDYLEPHLRQRILDAKLDFLCVPAFQRTSKTYHDRMSIDCDERVEGIYLVYANMRCEPWADGHSAFFALMDRMYQEKLEAAGFTDSIPERKVIEIPHTNDTIVVEVDITTKRPQLPRSVSSAPNVTVISTGQAQIDRQIQFVAKIAHDDERYRRIQELFVPPAEYDEILGKLEKDKLMFLVGDPGLGKTYTAVRFLRHYFDKGYEPIWFTGLEREERHIQRRFLQEFYPRDRQVVYFEDPFGRTTFERRDAIFQVFGPLSDALRDTDARVIVTSRKEVFERFSEESLNARELERFKTEMSVIRPSYSPENLLEILRRLAANRCEWYASDAARELVEEAVHDHVLTTPLAIRDLVLSTERIASATILATRIRRRQRETALTFAQELQACTGATKLALFLVYLFGHKHQLTLVTRFANSVKAGAIPTDEHSSTFLEEIRPQLGYRVEKYGATHSGFRFTHPIYEEAFVECALSDTVLQEIAAVSIEIVTMKVPRETVDSILRHTRKYPEYTLSLLGPFAETLIKSAHSDVMVNVGLRLISAYDQLKDRGFLECLQRITSIPAMVDMINRESRADALAGALRLAVNYQTRIEPGNFDDLASRIDWERLQQALWQSPRFNAVIYALEWAAQVRPAIVTEFVGRMSTVSVQRRFGTLHPSERKRLQQLVLNPELKAIVDGWETNVIPERWSHKREQLASQPRPEAYVIVDAGAAKALRRKRQRRNLLAIGVLDVIGDFEEGEAVSIRDETGSHVGVGLVEYTANEVRDIMGRHSSMITEILGRYHGPAVMRGHAIVLG